MTQKPRAWISHHIIADDLRRRIKSGSLKRGDKLPSFEQLHRQFGVASTTVSKALSLLEADGLVDRRERSGVFVTHSAERRRRPRIAVTGMMAQEEPFTDYYLRLFNGIQAKAQAFGAEVALAPGHIDMAWDEYDGHLSVGEFAIERFTQRPGHVPVVAINSLQPGAVSFAPNEFEAGYIAANHLIDLGHTKIAYLGWLLSSATKMRIAGYQTALQSLGEVDTRMIRPLGFDRQNGPMTLHQVGKQNMESWLCDDFDALGCTAILVQNDYITSGVLECLISSGRSVPEDISVIGFDNERDCATMNPPLTSVASDMFALGSMSVKALLNMIEGSYDTRSATLLSATLTNRLSTGPVPVGRSSPSRIVTSASGDSAAND